MTDKPLPIKLATGLSPELLECQLGSLASSEIKISNLSELPFSQIKLTISYYDSEGKYLDFEDVELDDISGFEEIVFPLELDTVDESESATIDIEGVKQTFLKRNWKLISTVVVVIWGLIILSRRLAPDFT